MESNDFSLYCRTAADDSGHGCPILGIKSRDIRPSLLPTSNSHFGPEHGCVVLDQPQHISNFHRLGLISSAAAGSAAAAQSRAPQNENCWLSTRQPRRARSDAPYRPYQSEASPPRLLRLTNYLADSEGLNMRE